MFEEILPGLYRMEIPLPNSPLRAVNSYLIKSPGRNLIIDTGMNRRECLDAFRQGLEGAGIEPGETDFFITHMHADHSGLVPALAAETSLVYCSQPDSTMICPEFSPEEEWYKDIRAFAIVNGLPENIMLEALLHHPGYKYSPRGQINFHIVGDGDVISYGEYTFRCVATPGHTPGHMCLYDEDRKMLVSGDHILGDITPNISLWIDHQNPLREYLQSLDKVSRMNVGLVLPGHRGLIRNCRERIAELRAHHQKRSEEVLSIVGNKYRDAYQVASRMSWDMTYPWDNFPAPQKWFATGEAMAHLKYLEEDRLVRRDVRDGRILFSSPD